MFTGFNSNVELDGRVYHVQTEDMGLDHPVLETRAYVDGRVVASVRSSYADLADSPDYSSDRIQQRMQEQHRGLIEDLECGHLETRPRIRLRVEMRNPDPHNLVEEYVDLWIETSELMAGVHRALERRINSARRDKKKNSRSGSRSR